MLRITPSTSSEGAKKYFSTADYYSEGQELVGQWRGNAAARLGLAGEIRQADWDALCENRIPGTNRTLTLRNKANRRVGYDFNFHVPKSLSVLHALTQDDRLLDAFRDSVRETMDDVEAEMKARVRKGGRSEDRMTGNVAWGEYVHFTSRPIDGIPDPHLHAHCFVFNTTFDQEEQVWKAGQFGDVKRDAPYFEAKFHVRLGHKLAELGIATERNRKGWEIDGFTPAMVRKFSRRTAEIEAEAKRLGIMDADAKAELGAKTRQHKQKDLPLPHLRALWAERLTDEESDIIRDVAAKIGTQPIAEDQATAKAAIDLAADHCLERSSVVPERTLIAEALRRSIGRASVETVEAAYKQEDFLVREHKGRAMATTPKVLEEERRMIAFARTGRGSRKPIALGPHRFTREKLNAGQRRATEHVLNSTDRVVLIRGAAGTGKTSMMLETAEAIEAAGYRVFTFAPSARASRGVLRDEGLEDADTIARLLQDRQLQQGCVGQIIWVDEAGMVGTRTMGQLFALAEKFDARIVLSGDRRQHGSVERGAALRLLEEQAGLVPAELKQIQRQRDAYMHAVHDLSEDRIADGFAKLDSLGWIKEIPQAERYEQLARDYVATVTAGENALIVSPTHSEGERITQSVREQLKQNGVIYGPEESIPVLLASGCTVAERKDAANYTRGDTIVFHQNAKGFTKGDRVTVGDAPLPLTQAERFELFYPGRLAVAAGDVLRITRNGRTAEGKRLNNGDLVKVAGFDRFGNLLTDQGMVGRAFGHLAHGVVVTSHASQGSSVDRVFVGQSAESFPASSRQQFYVTASRARKQVTIYTSSKGGLLDAVRKADERLSATELLSADMIEARIAPPRQPSPTHPPRTQTFTYDR